MDEALDKEVLQRLYDLLVRNPGLHISKIAELLSVTVAEVEQCLRILDKQGILLVSKAAGYSQYSIDERGVSAREKRSLETRRRIYDLVVKNPGLHLSKIAELLQM